MRLVQLPTARFTVSPSYGNDLSEDFIEEQVMINPECWKRSEVDGSFVPTSEAVALFDQNGYDLTYLEQLFAERHNLSLSEHRNANHTSIRKGWLVDADSAMPADNGAVHLNHCYLFERKSFEHNALRQLITWIRAGASPHLSKLISLRAKWGIDLSIDYADGRQAFEVLHFEWDSFSYDLADTKRHQVTSIVTEYSPERWTSVAQDLMRRSDEWFSLPFFEQSDWKCNYFQLPKEQFKMVCWSTTDA